MTFFVAFLYALLVCYGKAYITLLYLLYLMIEVKSSNPGREDIDVERVVKIEVEVPDRWVEFLREAGVTFGASVEDLVLQALADFLNGLGDEMGNEELREWQELMKLGDKTAVYETKLSAFARVFLAKSKVVSR